jgi:hypothetical protein
MNKFRQTGTGSILCTPGRTLIAADTLCYVRASPNHAPSYLCLHRFDDYVIICKLMKADLAGMCSILDQKEDRRNNWFVIYYDLSNIQPPSQVAEFLLKRPQLLSNFNRLNLTSFRLNRRNSQPLKPTFKFPAPLRGRSLDDSVPR